MTLMAAKTVAKLVVAHYGRPRHLETLARQHEHKTQETRLASRATTRGDANETEWTPTETLNH